MYCNMFKWLLEKVRVLIELAKIYLAGLVDVFGAGSHYVCVKNDLYASMPSDVKSLRKSAARRTRNRKRKEWSAKNIRGTGSGTGRY